MLWLFLARNDSEQLGLCSWLLKLDSALLTICVLLGKGAWFLGCRVTTSSVTWPAAPLMNGGLPWTPE